MPFSRLKLEPCTPPVWARGGHAQTVLGHLLPSKMLRRKGARMEIALDDGDRLVASYFEGGSNALVYLFHGLGGHLDQDYMHRTAALCLDQGHSVLAVNHRGCGEGAGLAKSLYHSGRAEDLAAAIALGRARWPGKRHLAIGFSLSANALLLLLGGARAKQLGRELAAPDLAVAVNAPIDLERSSHELKRGFSRVYDLRFVLNLRADVARKRRAGAVPGGYFIPPWATLREFDAVFTAPAAGFRDRDEYYRTCSSGPGLRDIRVPTVLLHSEDDPFIPAEPYRAAKLSPTCVLHLEPVGGHMGYLCARRTPLGSRRWLDYALDAYVRRLLE